MHTLKYKYLIATTVLISTCVLADSVVPSQLNFRSQSRDTAAKIVGTTSYQTHLFDECDDDTCHGMIFMRPAYFRSFQGSKIAECLFGDVLVPSETTNNCSASCNNVFYVSGTGLDANDELVVTRGDKDLMAENFYLPRDFESKIKIDPKISTFLVDFHLYVALDEWCPGLYFRIYGPFAHVKYDLGFSEDVINPGTIALGFYEPGYFAEFEVPADELLRSFSEYARGDVPPIINSGLIIQGLQYNKMICGGQTENGFADLRFELGYDFFLTDNYHLGLNVQFAAPTGPKQKPDFLFYPQVGNGHHWELGFGVTGHLTCWKAEDELSHIDVMLEADITHMFAVKEMRTLDLVGKGLSRYMLAMRFNESSVGTLHQEGDAAVVPFAAFAKEYAPVANISTQQVKVSMPIQADITLMFNYTCQEIGIDIGYNFWMRSCEKISLDDCNPFPNDVWGLKGDASMFGFTTETIPNPNTPPPTNIIVPNLNDPYVLSATELNATIHAGTNLNNAATDLTNPNIDNPVLAAITDDTDTEQILVMGTEITPDATTGVAYEQIYTSIEPVLLLTEDLDLQGARTRGMSNKFFVHVNYTWLDCDDWTPFVGIGAQAEVGRNHGNGSNCSGTKTTTNNACPACEYCSLTQWGVWLKAGLSWD